MLDVLLPDAAGPAEFIPEHVIICREGSLSTVRQWCLNTLQQCYQENEMFLLLTVTAAAGVVVTWKPTCSDLFSTEGNTHQQVNVPKENLNTTLLVCRVIVTRIIF